MARIQFELRGRVNASNAEIDRVSAALSALQSAVEAIGGQLFVKAHDVTKDETPAPAAIVVAPVPVVRAPVVVPPAAPGRGRR